LKEKIPASEHGFIFLKPWREISPRPRDKTEALAFIRSVIDEHVGRLQELLAEHEEIEDEEAAERCDRAALDCSPAFERHRRYQSAWSRELLRTLDTLRKMRNAEFGTGNGDAQQYCSARNLREVLCECVNLFCSNMLRSISVYDGIVIVQY
jgi:hypothetical protein